MSIMPEELDMVRKHRQVYLSTSAGRAVLMQELWSVNLFGQQQDWWAMLESDKPDVELAKLIHGLFLLYRCGVFVPENFERLIAKMAELPEPDVIVD